jgi:hypothetical protein
MFKFLTLIIFIGFFISPIDARIDDLPSGTSKAPATYQDATDYPSNLQNFAIVIEVLSIGFAIFIVVVFLFMAWNISRIRQILEKPQQIKNSNIGELS